MDEWEGKKRKPSAGTEDFRILQKINNNFMIINQGDIVKSFDKSIQKTARGWRGSCEMIIIYADLPEEKFEGAYIRDEEKEIILIQQSLKGTMREKEIVSQIENGNVEVIYVK